MPQTPPVWDSLSEARQSNLRYSHGVEDAWDGWPMSIYLCVNVGKQEQDLLMSFFFAGAKKITIIVLSCSEARTKPNDSGFLPSHASLSCAHLDRLIHNEKARICKRKYETHQSYSWVHLE